MEAASTQRAAIKGGPSMMPASAARMRVTAASTIIARMSTVVGGGITTVAITTRLYGRSQMDSVTANYA